MKRPTDQLLTNSAQNGRFSDPDEKGQARQTLAPQAVIKTAGDRIRTDDVQLGKIPWETAPISQESYVHQQLSDGRLVSQGVAPHPVFSHGIAVLEAQNGKDSVDSRCPPGGLEFAQLCVGPAVVRWKAAGRSDRRIIAPSGFAFRAVGRWEAL